MNDVGKTNFIYALRYIFDYSIRKNGFLLTDFFNKEKNNPIEILVEVDISNKEHDDVQRLIAKAEGAIGSSAGNIFFIKLISKNNSNLKRYDGIIS